MLSSSVNLRTVTFRTKVAQVRPKLRADLLLVELGLAESRERAQALIMEGLVYSSRTGQKVLKPGTLLARDDHPLEVRGRLPYVGRGGVKLAHALESFGLDVAGTVALDVGASTGGFTDCLLQRGTRLVYAVDVGRGQIDDRLRRDPRVVVMEGVHAGYPFELSGGVGLATVDVSFISFTRVLPHAARHVRDGGPIIALVKPQFEAPRRDVGRGGVIRDPRVHAAVLARAIAWVVGAGFRLRDLVPSPILGDAGNREFFLLLENTMAQDRLEDP